MNQKLFFVFISQFQIADEEKVTKSKNFLVNSREEYLPPE